MPLGRSFRACSMSHGYRHAITGTLWPDEAAWRLRLELKRTRGYAPGETVTFRNVPVPKVGTTNLTPMTGFAGGMKLVLTEFERKPDITINAMGIGYMASRIRVELPTHPDGVALDFVEITTDTREKPVTCGETSSSPFDRAVLFAVLLKSIPAGVQTMDITWVVQKTRSVEFLVKPP